MHWWFFLSKLTSTINIGICDDHDQGYFRLICKFILRDINGIDSFVIKNAHIDHEKERNEVLKINGNIFK